MDLMSFIEKMSSGVDFGTIQFTVKRHDSHVSSVDAQKMTSHMTTGNEQALSIVIALLKAAKATEETGNMTFTINLDKGEASRVIVQDMRRVIL